METTSLNTHPLLSIGNATIERKSLEQYTLSIEEQMPAGTKLAQLILNDLDSSGKNSYCSHSTT